MVQQLKKQFMQLHTHYTSTKCKSLWAQISKNFSLLCRHRSRLLFVCMCARDLYLCKLLEIFIFGCFSLTRCNLAYSTRSGKCLAHYLCLYKLYLAIYGIYWSISALVQNEMVNIDEQQLNAWTQSKCREERGGVTRLKLKIQLKKILILEEFLVIRTWLVGPWNAAVVAAAANHS